MRSVKAFAWSAAIVAIVCGVSLLRSQQTSMDASGCNMLLRALAAYGKLEPGLTRAQIERDFRQEGGIFNRSKVRYHYKECLYIKLEVEYTPGSQEAEEMRSAGDIVRTLSGLTIGYAVTD